MAERLSGETAEKVLGEVLQGGSRDERADALKKDWRGFLRREFDLSDEQAEELESLAPEEVVKIQGAFIEAIDLGGEVSMQLGDDGGDAELSVRIFKKEKEEGGGTIFHCHRAKRLRDWVCHWGPVEPAPQEPPPNEKPPDGPLDPGVPPPPSSGPASQ